MNAQNPTKITSIRPVISTMVSTTLSLTLSPTPRRLTAATSDHEEQRDARRFRLCPSRSPKPLKKFDAKNRDAVDADVMPEHITMNATRNVDEVDAEGLVRVERRAGGLRILGDQFEVAERGDGGDQEGDQERQPGRPTDFGGHVTGQRVDAGAEDVADDEQQQQPGAHHPLQFGLLLDSALAP